MTLHALRWRSTEPELICHTGLGAGIAWTGGKRICRTSGRQVRQRSGMCHRYASITRSYAIEVRSIR
eukprot:8026823-Heterocapsa_arctica.AAC.1